MLAGFLLLKGHDLHYAHNWNRLLPQARPPESQGGGNARQRERKTETGRSASATSDGPANTQSAGSNGTLSGSICGPALAVAPRRERACKSKAERCERLRFSQQARHCHAFSPRAHSKGLELASSRWLRHPCAGLSRQSTRHRRGQDRLPGRRQGEEVR